MIDLDIDTQPFICKFFQQLSASTKTRHVQSKLIKEKIQPNYLDCYCQFGAFQDKSRFPEAVNCVNTPAENQLLWIRDTYEFVISYEPIQYDNLVAFGRVSGPGLSFLKDNATIDGTGRVPVWIENI